MASTPAKTPPLGYRARRILSAVVSEYIATGEPVGSRTLSKRYGLNLSPATIRNELADLEEAGCLLQPHTSSGRVPSELGFRIFIDALAQLREVAVEDRQAIVERMRQLRPGVDDVVREAGRVLAQLTGAAALVTRPRTDVEPIRELRFMPIRDRTLVAVIVTKSGSVENRIVELAATPSELELERLHHLLAEVVAGRTLTDARAQLVARMQTERGEYDALKRRAKELLDGVSRSADARDVIIEGQGRLFDRPEFSDPEKIRGFVRAFEDKEQLLELLERTMASGGVQVLVGSETNLARVPDVGMISADYRTGGVQAGSVGIIGPTRMDYAKLMPLVAFTADIVGEALDKGGHDDDDE